MGAKDLETDFAETNALPDNQQSKSTIELRTVLNSKRFWTLWMMNESDAKTSISVSLLEKDRDTSALRKGYRQLTVLQM